MSGIDEMRPEYDIRGGVRGKYFHRYTQTKGGRAVGRHVNWDEVPDSTLLPNDLYMFEVDDLTEETSKKGKLMYRGVFRVVEGAMTGAPLYEYFAVGTDDDPTATDDATWKNSIGVRRLKRLFKATGITMSPDVDENVEACKQQRFVGAVSQEVDDGTRDPKYMGVKRNRIDGMYQVGTKLPGAVTNGPVAAPAAVGGNAAPAPLTGPRPAGAASAARAPKAATAPTVNCPFCSESILRSQYSAHIASAHPDER